MRFALRVSRYRIDAESIFASERLRRIDTQRCSIFLTLYEDEFFPNRPIECKLLWELLMNLDVLQFDKKLVLRMITLGKRIGKPLRAIRLNLNTHCRAPFDLRDRARDMCETHCFPLCLTGSRP